MKKARIVLTLIICLAMLCAVSSAFADAGGFSGDSNYGGGGSSGGGFDFGGGFGWLGYDDGSRSGGSVGFEVVFIIIIVIVIIVIAGRKSKSAAPSVSAGAQPTSQMDLRPIEEYVAEHDEGFSVMQIENKVSNLYVQFQNTWAAKDISPMAPYFTDELYTQFDRQLSEIRAKHETPHIERIGVLGATIRGYQIRDGRDHLIIDLRTRITTYTTDDATGNIVRGDPKLEKFMRYEWDLCRTSGRKTGAAAQMQVVNCPNCGAPVSINMTAKCPYCDSVITVKEHDWLICNIKGISQKTV